MRERLILGREAARPVSAAPTIRTLDEVRNDIVRMSARAAAEAYRREQRMRQYALAAKMQPSLAETYEQRMREEAREIKRTVEANRENTLRLLGDYARSDVRRRVYEARKGIRPLPPGLRYSFLARALKEYRARGPWDAE